MTNADKLRAWLAEADFHCQACLSESFLDCQGSKNVNELLSICRKLLAVCESVSDQPKRDFGNLARVAIEACVKEINQQEIK